MAPVARTVKNNPVLRPTSPVSPIHFVSRWAERDNRVVEKFLPSATIGAAINETYAPEANLRIIVNDYPKISSSSVHTHRSVQ